MFEREQRYIVLKITDIAAVKLSAVELAVFNATCDKVSRSRLRRAKKPLQCLVIESDWPEYEPTWQAIKQRMDETPNAVLSGAATEVKPKRDV